MDENKAHKIQNLLEQLRSLSREGGDQIDRDFDAHVTCFADSVESMFDQYEDENPKRVWPPITIWDGFKEIMRNSRGIEDIETDEAGDPYYNDRYQEKRIRFKEIGESYISR